MDWRKFWALVVVGLLVVFVPGFFLAAADVFNQTADKTVRVADQTYSEATNTPAPYIGEPRVVEVAVRFEVNRDYRGWGQLFASLGQYAQIAGSAYATNGSHDTPRTALGQRIAVRNPPDLRCSRELQRSCQSQNDCGGARGICEDVEMVMRWNDVRVVVPQPSDSVGWRLCVELHETLGVNILGAAQDGLHVVGLSDGDIPVADECTALDNNGFPLDYERAPLTRPGETVPMGWFDIRWEGPNG